MILKSLKPSRRLTVYSGAVAVLLIIVAIILISGHSKRSGSVIPSRNPESQTNVSQAANDAQNGSDTSGSSSSQSASAKNSAGDNQSSGAALTLAAAQTLVSNHHPGQNGSPTSEQSVCNTTPGATCYIQFTMNDTTKQLSPEVADSNGTAIWNWDVNNSDLSSGSWKVQAIASLNGQAKTTTDPALLEVP